MIMRDTSINPKSLGLGHRGYTGSIKIDCESNTYTYHGKVRFIDDAVIYQGDNLKELGLAFIDAVDEYLDTCKEMGKEPNKPTDND